MREKLNMSVFSKRLKDLRKKRKLTQKQLSDLMTESGNPLSVKSINSWENADSDLAGAIRVRNLVSVCEALDCDPEHLLGGIEARTKDASYFHQVTGLQENAIDILKETLEQRQSLYGVDLCNAFIEDVQMWENISSLVDYIAGYKLPDMTISGNTLYSDMLYVESGLYYRCQQIFMTFIERIVNDLRYCKEG